MTDAARRLAALSPIERDRLLVLLQDARQRGAALEAPLIARPTSEPRGDGPQPVSLAQRRLWTQQMLDPANPAYNFHVVVRLEGGIHHAALARTLNEVVRRHDVLRTAFRLVGNRPMQIATAWRPLPLPVIDLAALPAEGREPAAWQLLHACAREPFALDAPPLWRPRLFRLGDTDGVLFIGTHHLVFDGWSMRVLVEETRILYEAFVHGRESPLPPLAIQYADAARWQHDQVGVTILDRQRTYWRERLAGIVPLLLPVDFPRPAAHETSWAGETRWMTFPSDVAASVLARGQEEGATPFMTLLTVFHGFLHECARARDVVVGFPVSNRHRLETEPLIGFFVNTLMIRTRPAPDATCRQLLREVRDAVLDAQHHQDLPLEEVLDLLRRDGLASRSVLRVVFAQNTPVGRADLSGLRVSALALDNNTAKFDLSLNVSATDADLRIAWNYRTALFRPSTIDAWMAAFVRIARCVVTQPDAPVLYRSPE